MTLKRLRLRAAAAAAISLALSGAAAHAEDVTAVLTQDQANRLSLFHDYGLNAIGSANYFAIPVNVGNPNDVGHNPVAGVAGSGVMTAALGPRYASTDPTGTGRPFELFASPVLGYDSNPEARRTARDSAFAGGELGVAYHITDGPDDPIAGQPLRATFAYNLLGAAYEGQVQNADVLQQNISASVRQTLFDNSWILSSTIADGFTVEHSSAFLNTIDAGATGEFFFAPQLSVETGLNFTKFIYFYESVLPAQKADAERYTFVAKGHVYSLSQRRGAKIDEAPDVLTEVLRESVRRLTINYAHVWNIPDRRRNRDYKYEANRIGFGLDGLTLPSRVGRTSLGTYGRALSLDVDYNHEFQQYQYANTASQPIITPKPRGGRLTRKDGIDVFTLRGNARLFDLPHDAGTLAAYLQWDLIDDGSNIRARNFDEYVISGGITYRY